MHLARGKSCEVQGAAVPMWWMGRGHPGTIQVNGIDNHTNEPETTQCCGNDFLVALH